MRLWGVTTDLTAPDVLYPESECFHAEQNVRFWPMTVMLAEAELGPKQPFAWSIYLSRTVMQKWRESVVSGNC